MRCGGCRSSACSGCSSRQTPVQLMTRSAILRWRLDKVPVAVWAALFAAALSMVAAFSAGPAAAIWMLIAAAACFLAWRAFRETGRTVIAPRDDEIELVGLAEL